MSTRKVFFSIVSLILCLCLTAPALAGVLKLPEGVKIIEDEAFYKDTSLDEVILPEGIEEIGERAFADSSLRKINLPDSLQYVADSAFDNCVNLEHEGEPTVNPDDFEYEENGDGTCTVKKYKKTPSGDLVIPSISPSGSVVTGIRSSAFYNCSGFTGSLTIPDSVTSIGQGAFYGCSGLTGSLMIPDSVISIGKNAFYGCSGFTGNLTIPDSVKSIGISAFSGCSGFTGSLTIPDGVKTIYKESFSGCSGFTGSLTISDSVVVIGTDAFRGCSGFTGSLTIPDSVASIGGGAFYGCSGFTGSLTISDSVRSIGDYAFYECRGFTGSLTIPDRVTSIGDRVFYECSGFTGSLTISDSLKSIGCDAFWGCSGFTGSLTIPNSVTSIGDAAFCGCSGFTGSLTIPNSVTSISKRAFRECSGFTGSLTIPDNVISIGQEAFYGCSGFTGNLTIPDSVTDIGDYTFQGCSGFTGSLTISDSVTSIGVQAFAYCNGFTGSLTIPENVTSIGSRAFQICSGFTGSLIIPHSVINIGDYAFSECSGFTGSLTLQNGVKTIGEGAFGVCSGFTGSLTIPGSVTSVGNYAFDYCSGFTGNLTIPDSVTSIGNDAFYGCNFERVSVPVTLSDGTTNEVSRIAVYCPVDSYAWRWATEQSDFEPVEWDGSGTPTTDPKLSGAFTNRTMTIVLGDTSQIPAATVQSTGDPIHRVTLTISGWSPEGSTSDRYRTHTFENQNLQTISLTDPEWAADFMLDTTQPPLNTPGEYTINLWANASDTDSSLEPLDSMTVTVQGVSGDSIAGSIHLSSGEPISNVNVYLYDDSNHLAGYTSSDSQGKWNISELTEGKDYYIYYGHLVYKVSGNGSLVALGTYLSAIASVDGDVNQDLSFTMKKGDAVIPDGGSIEVGTAVEFTVNAPGATSVKLFVDDRTYTGDEYPVEDGVATFTRTFTKAGTRKIQFQAYISDKWELQNGIGTLVVTKTDDLKKPKVDVSGNGYTGDPVTFKIETVDQAENYYIKVYLVDSGITVYQKQFSAETMSQMDYTLVVGGENFLKDGTYCISIIVTGTHYSQNDSQKTFEVQKHAYTVHLSLESDAIGIVAGDSVGFRLTQTAGAYSTISVTGNEGTVYYPEDNDHIITDASSVETILFADPGEYQITAYTYASALNPEINLPEGQSETLRISVAERELPAPCIFRKDLGMKYSSYTWIDEKDPAKLYVATNDVVDAVYISLNDGEEQPFTKVSNDGNWYVADLILNQPGRQTAIIKAIDTDTTDENGTYPQATDSFSFYFVQNLETGYYVYPNVEEVSVKTSPIDGGYMATEKGGEWFEHMLVLAEAGDWLRVQTNSGAIGFVELNSVTADTPASGNGKIEILMPVAGQQLSTDVDLQISWRAGIRINNSIILKLTNVDTLEITTIPMNGYYRSTADISKVNPGKYLLSVAVTPLTRAANSIESAPVECIIGGYDQEIVDRWKYNKWFSDYILDPYVYYMLRYHEVPNQYSAPSALWKAWDKSGVGSTVSSGNGILDTGLFNNETETAWSSADESLRKKIDLIVIGDMVKTDAQKNYVALRKDYTTVKESFLESAKSAQSLSQIRQNFNLFSAGGEEIKLVLKANKVFKGSSDPSVQSAITNDGAYAAKFTNALDQFLDKFDDILDVIWDSTVEAVLSLSSEYDSLQISYAYKKEYAKNMREASDAYIDAFEIAVFGGVGKSASIDERNLTRAEASAMEYINAFNTLKNREDSIMETEAMRELTNYSNKTYTDFEIEEMHDDYWKFLLNYISTPENWQPLFEIGLCKYIEKSFKNDFKDMEGFSSIPGQILETFIKEDIPVIISSMIKFQDDGTILNFDNMYNTLFERLKMRGVTLTAATAIPIIIAIFEVIAKAGSVNVLDKVACLGKVKEICEKASEQIKGIPFYAVIKIVLGIGKSAWKTGTKISKTINSAIEYQSQMSGKTEFESYTSCMADSYYMGQLICARNNLIPADFQLMIDVRMSGPLGSKSIQELEIIRNALISLSNFDEISLAYLLSMRNANELSGWRFILHGDSGGQFTQKDYPSEQQIKEEIDLIRTFRNNLQNVPSNIQTIIDRHR